MPPAKKRGRRVASKSRSRRGASATRRKSASRSNPLRCPDCDFVAAHPRGLGRHRSARHGVLSGRQRRRETSGAWLTRREAARRAGVHYNTIRHWEQTGRLRKSKQAGSRGAMVSAVDLDSVVRGGSAGSSAGGGDGRVDALEKRFNDLLNGLEALVVSARGRRKRGRPRKV